MGDLDVELIALLFEGIPAAVEFGEAVLALLGAEGPGFKGVEVAVEPLPPFSSSAASAGLDLFNDFVHPVRAGGLDVRGHSREAGALLLL